MHNTKVGARPSAAVVMVGALLEENVGWVKNDGTVTIESVFWLTTMVSCVLCVGLDTGGT